MWQSIAKTKALSIALLLLLGCGHFLWTGAQNEASDSGVAVKFDEYGQINGEDQSARLDNYASQLQNVPTLVGYVIAYGPQGKGWGTGQNILEIIKEYLVNSRGIADDRLKLIYGGRNRDLTKPKVELWIAPPTSPPPDTVEMKTDIETFKGMFAQVDSWDEIPITNRFDEEGCCGPPVPEASRASFADLMQVQKQARGYIAAFNGPDAVPGAWKRVAERQVEDFKDRGVDQSRLRIVYGGAAKKTGFQLWVTSVNAPPPVKDAGPERPPSKAVEVGTYSDEVLGDEKNAQAIIDRVSDSLRLQPTLRAYLIVRHGVPPDDESQEEGTSTSDDETESYSEPPATAIVPANITAVVENWRRLLRSKYKIGDNRFVTSQTISRDYEGTRLQLWLVPKDQPLPDPDAEPENDPEDF